MNIKPLGDRVLIEPLSPQELEGKTASGIVIPETADKERPEQGRVLAVGAGKRLDSGELVKPEVNVGDRVLFSKYSPTEIKVDDESASGRTGQKKELLIVREEDILAIIE